jgi:hypothetical protein
MIIKEIRINDKVEFSSLLKIIDSESDFMLFEKDER